jgi:hypothetical protein
VVSGAFLMTIGGKKGNQSDRSGLFVEPGVFHPPAVEDAVDHDS